jgi:serine/threonine protein kinase
MVSSRLLSLVSMAHAGAMDLTIEMLALIIQALAHSICVMDASTTFHLRCQPLSHAYDVAKPHGAFRGYSKFVVTKKAIYGEIVTATCNMTKETVVLKKMRKCCMARKKRWQELDEKDEAPELLEDAVLEEAALQRLNAQQGHPNVVRHHQTFETDTDFVMVMEYLESELYQVVAESGGLDERRAQRYFADTAAGVQFIHAHGIAHRDISLENLLVSPSKEDSVKIIDFGLCCSLGVTCTKGPVGKPFYMAPEVLVCCYDAEKADIWSLGVVLFTMVVGAPPMEKANASDIRYRMIRDGRLREMLCAWKMGSLFSEPCLDLVERMLVVDPDARITMCEVLRHPWVSSVMADRNNSLVACRNDEEATTQEMKGATVSAAHSLPEANFIVGQWFASA